MNCILYVDDDEINTAITSMIFEDLQIAEKVVALTDGFMALEFLKTSTPEFIFVDMRMPSMDGVEFIQKVLQFPKSKNIRIIGISNHFSKEDKERLLECNISQLIEKPLTEKKIMMCISAAKEVI